jgi:ADP-ribose diphosphatase
MDKVPFTLKDRKVACDNSVFTVFFDHLINGKKSLVHDYIVIEPKVKNNDDITGVAILPVRKEEFGLVKIYRHAVSEYGWEVPRGFIDENETVKDAAIRELKEETGLICNKDRLKYLGTICPEPGVISAKVNIYQAVINDDEQIDRELELGHIEFNWFRDEEILKLIKTQQINDATTLATYFQSINI